MKNVFALASAIVSFGFVGSATAADLAVKAPPMVAPVVSSWTGFYAGIGLGARIVDIDGLVNYGTNNGVPLGTGSASCPTPTPNCPGLSFDSTAFRVSGYLGYNWQVGQQWLVGVEGDFGWANNNKTTVGALYPGGAQVYFLTGRSDDAFGVKADWDASLRARLGFLVTPSVLFYGTGGVAWQHLKATSTCGSLISCIPGAYGPQNITDQSARAGWTLGGGIEWMVAPQWIVRGEYRYADFGKSNYLDTRTCTGVCGAPFITQLASYSLDVKTQTVTFGVAYKFGP
jgi:outer membrane immunogenic protein